MAAVMRQCLDCVNLVPLPASRCTTHAIAHQDWLLTIEPWRQIYNTTRWRNLTPKIKRRDDFRCTYAVKGRRCANTNLNGNLSVHHLTKLRLLWSRHGEPKPGSERWQDFLNYAYDPANLVTLCTRHHKLADSTTIGEPIEKATSTRRKRVRHGRRQREPQAYTRDKRGWKP
jgi:5-methylcytosine-specific restriction endonuclease McrA